jgi:hypothetical protein
LESEKDKEKKKEKSLGRGAEEHKGGERKRETAATAAEEVS